jgi:glutathione S-transferase
LTATLYGIPASHPCAAIELALRLKGVDYRRVDIPPLAAKAVMWRKFGRLTVPGIEFGDGERVHGSRAILRALEHRAPDPPLLPADGRDRRVVEEAERWGDEVLQDAARWISQYAIVRRPDAAKSFLAGSSLPDLPGAVTAASSRATFRAEIATVGPGVDGVERRVRELPALLDNADELIAAGTIGGDPPNAADLQIGASVALLMKLADLRPAVESRPCAEIARRLFTSYPGEIPRNALPHEWLRASAASAAERSVTSAA